MSRRSDPDAMEAVACPFQIFIDTREQAPYRFTGMQDDNGRPLIVPLITDVALASGDYSIAGLEDRVAIERKSLSDWFQSIGRERDRFEREMQRLAEMKFAAVVIEGDWESILLRPPNSTQVSPKVASRTIASWSIRYGVHFYPTMNRRHAELWTFSLLSMFWRQHQRSDERIAEEVSAGV